MKPNKKKGMRRPIRKTKPVTYAAHCSIGHRKDRQRENVDGVSANQIRGKTFLIEFEYDMQTKLRKHNTKNVDLVAAEKKLRAKWSTEYDKNDGSPNRYK